MPTDSWAIASNCTTAPQRRAAVALFRCTPELRRAFLVLRGKTGDEGAVIRSERGGPQGMRPSSVVNWFRRLYRDIGLSGCSSHSGRRTFITNAARLVFKAGGSLRDVQQLAGHRSIDQTQAYIDGSARAKRRLIELI